MFNHATHGFAHTASQAAIDGFALWAQACLGIDLTVNRQPEQIPRTSGPMPYSETVQQSAVAEPHPIFPLSPISQTRQTLETH